MCSGCHLDDFKKAGLTGRRTSDGASGHGISGLPCLPCCHCDLDLDKGLKMDGLTGCIGV